MQSYANQFSQNFTFDTPLPYKNLTLHPVLMRDYYSFMYFSRIFEVALDKNNSGDTSDIETRIKMIEMEYLDYLIFLVKETSFEYLQMNPNILWFIEVLKLVTRRNDLIVTMEKREGKSVLRIDNEIFNSSDFEKLAYIISEWNSVLLPDLTISKALRDRLNDAKEFKNKISNSKPATLEEQIVCAAISLGKDIEYIYDMPIRKFSLLLKRMDAKIHYEIYLAASMSGMVKFENKNFIKHWLSNLGDDDRWSDVKVSYEEVENKINVQGGN
jgi:hypothetical protein